MSDVLPFAPVSADATSDASIAFCVVDAAGNLLRTVTCPRHAAASQVRAGETLVEAAIPRGKRYDHATQSIIDDTPPPQPEPSATWDAVAWRWITYGERNAVVLMKIRDLELSGSRSLRELILDRGTVAERLATRARLAEVDDQIATLRAQLT